MQKEKLIYFNQWKWNHLPFRDYKIIHTPGFNALFYSSRTFLRGNHSFLDESAIQMWKYAILHAFSIGSKMISVIKPFLPTFPDENSFF